MNTFAEGDLVVWVGIYYLQKLLDPRRVEILWHLLRVVIPKPDVCHQYSELLLVNHTISVWVGLLELLNEEQQELFMFTKLEVQHAFQEHVEFKFRFVVS